MVTDAASRIGLMNEFPDVQALTAKLRTSNFVINAKATQVSFDKHWGSLSIKCCLRGNEYYECRGVLYNVSDTSVLILNEGTYYSSYIDSKTEVESFTVHFTPDFEQFAFQAITMKVDDLLDNVPAYRSGDKAIFTEKLFGCSIPLIPILLRLKGLTKQWDANEEAIKEHFFFLYEELLANEVGVQRQVRQVDAVRHSTKAELFKRIHRAKDFISSHYYKNLTLEEMADVSALNHYYFLRQFKKMFHYTPHQYLQRRRVQEAAFRLRNGNYSISEICSEVGFSDLASFSKLFKRHYGQTPADYRSVKNGHY
jgi:AraC family transcriptional regulator